MPDAKQNIGKIEGSTRPQPGFEEPAAPEATNYNHPGKVGAREAVPGAGVVSAGEDAGPIISGTQDMPTLPHPGQPDACSPASGPNARRPGTTVSGAAAVPSSGGVGGISGSPATETGPSTPSGMAPFDLPSDTRGEPEGSSEILAPELADPNFNIHHNEDDIAHKGYGPNDRR